MNPQNSMEQWSASLQKQLPTRHAYQVQALAAFSFAAARARHCHLGRLAAHVPTQAQRPSTLRRLKRLLANERLAVDACCDELARWLGRWNQPGARLILLLDETPQHNTWRVLKMSVAYHRRALPLCWRTDPLTPRALRQRVDEVLAQTARLLARYCPQAEVVLLADRGLCWPQIIRFCQQHGWHFVLRAQRQTRFVWREAQGQAQDTALGELVPTPGAWWSGGGQAFGGAGWLAVNVVACWRQEAQEPWLLVTDQTPHLHLIRWYAKRMWQDESFRDEKSHGFCWQASQVQTAARMHRLLLILAVAQLWLLHLGTVATQAPWAAPLGLRARAERRRWSVFSRGYLLLLWCLDHGHLPPCHLDFSPP